jgi:hypothetical protein
MAACVGEAATTAYRLNRLPSPRAYRDERRASRLTAAASSAGSIGFAKYVSIRRGTPGRERPRSRVPSGRSREWCLRLGGHEAA